MHASDDGLTAEQRRLKDAFVEARDYWHPALDQLLRLDAAFFEKYRDLSTHPWEHGHLDPKAKDFVYVAVNASPATHVSPDAVRRHVGNALDHGATVSELLAVFEILSTAGVHSVLKGVPILEDEAGLPEDVDAETERERERVRRNFEAERGYWDDGLWADVLAVDHGYLEAYTNYSAHVAHYAAEPGDDGDGLAPLHTEYVYIALDVALPTFYLGGLRAHVKNALEYGAAREEVMEVFELASEVGSHSLTEGVPILVEEAERRGMLPPEE